MWKSNESEIPILQVLSIPTKITSVHQIEYKLHNPSKYIGAVQSSINQLKSNPYKALSKPHISPDQLWIESIFLENSEANRYITIYNLSIIDGFEIWLRMSVPEKEFGNNKQKFSKLCDSLLSISQKKKIEKQDEIHRLSLATRQKMPDGRPCPENWIDNQMPRICIDRNCPYETTQYFILGGKRVEIAGYNLEWITKYCKLKIEVSY